VPQVRTRIRVGEASIEDFDQYLEEMPWTVAESVEAHFGAYFPDWLVAIDAGSVKAQHVLAWLVLREKDPRLQLSAVKGALRSLKIENLATCAFCAAEQPVRRDPKTRALVCTVCSSVIPDDSPMTASPLDGAEASETDDESTKEPAPTTSESDPGSGTT
jgi:hypothetical protein